MTTTRPLSPLDFSFQGPSDLELAIRPAAAQRRWTIALRAILVLPGYLAMLGCGLVVLISLPAAWLVALVKGEPPAWARKLCGGSLLLGARVMSYWMFVHDEVPDVSWRVDPEYPVQLELPAARALNRWSVLLRGVLALPAAMLAQFAVLGLDLLLVIVWPCALVLGRAPRIHRQAAVAVLRYYLRSTAYGYLLTSRWPSPRWLFGDNGKVGGRLVLTRGARILLAVYLVVGAAFFVFNQVTGMSAGQAAASSVAAPVVLPPAPTKDPDLAAAYDQALMARIPDTTRGACTPTPASSLRPQEVSGRDCYTGKTQGAPEWLEYRGYRSPEALMASFCQFKVEINGHPCDAGTTPDSIIVGARYTDGTAFTTLAWMDQSNSLLITLDSTTMTPRQLAEYQDGHEFFSH